MWLSFRRVRFETLARRVVCVAVLLQLGAPSSFAGERGLEDEPAPSSIEDIEAPLERTYPLPVVRPSLFPWIRERTQDLTPFLADTQLYIRYRTYYLRQDRASGRLSEAWAMGGSVYYRSGLLKERFAVELEGFTSQPIVAPGDRDGTLLLQPGQEGYTVLGVANGTLRHGDYVLTGYRQKIDHPYLNRRDNRMTPITFEAVKFAKERGELRFDGGYAWNLKERNSDRFVSLSNRAGVSQDRGAAFWSALWTPREEFHLGTSGYVVPDVLATVYAESHYDLAPTDSLGLRFDAQFTSQNTLGDELLAGSPFHTWNVGLRTSASWRGLLGRLGFAITCDERGIESFYGSNPTYIGLMQRTFNHAGEKAMLASLSYDFSYFGVRDVSAIANYAQGWGGRTLGVRSDAREVNFTLDYRIGRGVLETLWLRFRAAWLEESAAPQNGTDFRVILRYELPVI